MNAEPETGRTLEEIGKLLDKAGIPTGNEHESYNVFERIKRLVISKEYAYRKLDEEREKNRTLIAARHPSGQEKWFAIRYRVDGEKRIKVMCGEAEIADGANVEDLENLIEIHNADPENSSMTRSGGGGG